MKKLLAAASLVVLLSPHFAFAAPTYSLDLEFSSSQSASKADNASLSITGDITLLCYVKLESTPATTGQNAGVISKNASGGSVNDGYSFRLRNNGGNVELSAYYSDGSNTRTREWTPGTIVTDTWYAMGLAMDVDAGKQDFYLDSTMNTGTGAGSATAINDDNGDTYIGWDRLGSGRYLDGKLKDCMIITAYLSEAQIDAIFTTATLCGTTPPSNTAAWWKFENAYTDTSGNANTLTAVNSPTFASDAPYVCPAADAGFEFGEVI